MLTFTELLFVGAVMLPPVVLAVGFLIVASPRAIERAERSEHTGHVTAKAH